MQIFRFSPPIDYLVFIERTAFEQLEKNLIKSDNGFLFVFIRISILGDYYVHRQVYPIVLLSVSQDCDVLTMKRGGFFEAPLLFGWHRCEFLTDRAISREIIPRTSPTTAVLYDIWANERASPRRETCTSYTRDP